MTENLKAWPPPGSLVEWQHPTHSTATDSELPLQRGDRAIVLTKPDDNGKVSLFFPRYSGRLDNVGAHYFYRLVEAEDDNA